MNHSEHYQMSCLKNLIIELVYCGPNLAKEIADKKIAGTVIASTHDEVIDNVKSILSSKNFKIYSSKDVQGIELAGSLEEYIRNNMWNG